MESAESVDVRKNRQLTLDNMKLQREVILIIIVAEPHKFYAAPAPTFTYRKTKFTKEIFLKPEHFIRHLKVKLVCKTVPEI
jgi:hypothetical protein